MSVADGLVLLRIIPVQAHVVGDVVKFLATDVIQTLAAISKFLVNLQGFLSHLLVSIFRAAHQRKVISLRDSLVTIRVETHPQHHSLLILLRQTRHVRIINKSTPCEQVETTAQSAIVHYAVLPSPIKMELLPPPILLAKGNPKQMARNNCATFVC